MTAHPHTIENAAGERLTFTRRITARGGERIEGETVVSPGAGPPMHVHYLQDEGFTVLEGRIGFQRPGREPEFGEAGASVLFRAGEPPRFWVAGETPLRCAASIEPAGNAEFCSASM